MLTLTAPGAGVLPWDVSKCNHSASVACAGDLGCVVEGRALAVWHDDIGQRWSWFMTEVRRLLGVDVQFFKTYEPQRRGALHIHGMMRAAGVTDRRLKAAVRLAASRWGFGRQYRADAVDLSDARAVAMTAGYCAKYCAKTSDAMPDVVRMNVDGELRHGGLRAWSASRRWGDTMRLIEARRGSWAAATRLTEEAGGGAGSAATLDLNVNLYATEIDGLRIFRPVAVPAAV